MAKEFVFEVESSDEKEIIGASNRVYEATRLLHPEDEEKEE